MTLARSGQGPGLPAAVRWSIVSFGAAALVKAKGRIFDASGRSGLIAAKSVRVRICNFRLSVQSGRNPHIYRLFLK
jgi:hypothetical protein